MADLRKEWCEHIEVIDKSLSVNELTGKTLNKWMEPLTQAITSDGAVPYLIGTNERYRASPLASTISWLEKANLVSKPVLSKMQEALLLLRDQNIKNDPHITTKQKKPEDQNGWSLGEGVSVWSTSCAIEALLDTHGNGDAYTTQLKPSILWLANQRNTHGAWAYQLSENCTPNVIMTSLALRSLALAYAKANRLKFCFSKEESLLLERAIRDGFDYIRNNCNNKKRKVYWCFNEEPHCAATTWALLALHWVSLCDAEISPECKKFFETNREKALAFVCSKIPKQSDKWSDEPFVYEGGAKYGKQKNYVSFSATLLPQLFELGLSPFHPRVINQIKWLVEHPEEWKIETYDKGKVCYFTYAMVISTITSWIQQVGLSFASILLRTSKNKVPIFLYGYNSMGNLQSQLVQSNRITMVSIVLLFLVVALLFGNQIEVVATWLSTNILSLWSKTEGERYDVIIGVISNFLEAGIMGICLMLGACVKNLWRWICR